MGTRFGLKVGGFAAAVACALLVACGGGGGGGGGGGSVTPPTQAPATISPTSQATSGPLSTTGTTAINFSGVSNGTANLIASASFTAPQVGSATTGSVTLQASLPSGVPSAPQIRRVQMRAGQALCSTCTMQALAYFVFSVNPGTTITSSPAVTVAMSSAPPAGTAYLVVYFNGAWQEVSPGLGQTVVAAASSMSFPSAPVNPSPLTLAANTNYVFAVVDVTSGAIPTPTPGGAATLPPVSGTQPCTPPNCGFSPYDVASTFGFPVQSGFDGTGKTIAIIGDVPPAMSDLTSYLSMWNLPNNLSSTYSVVPVTGVSVSQPSRGDIDESTLDVETVLGLAPGASIVFYNTQGDLSNAAFLLAEKQVAASNGGNGPDVFSISFGGCEQDPTPAPGTLGAQPPDAVVFAGMAAKGTAVFASSGDQGDDCYVSQTQNILGVNYPASDPNVVGVGGNETTPGNTPKPSQVVADLTNPVAWNDNFSGNPSGTGGGVSTTFTPPPYQNGLAGAASSMRRNIPDIAMPAEGTVISLTDPVNGCPGGPCVFGGTSWSAPEAAALMASVDEFCSGRPSSPVGLWYQVPAADYVDITSGNNALINSSGPTGLYPDTVVTYSAHAGYDNTTGLGVPKGIAVAQALCAGGRWTAGPRGFAADAFVREAYGEARDTTLPFAQRFDRASDLGPRDANAMTTALLVLRNTATAASDEQTVIAALRSAGFTIANTSSDHSYVQVTAPTSTMAAYFRTSFHEVWQGNYGTKYANATPITIPAAIAPYVSTVMADTLVARVARPIRMR